MSDRVGGVEELYPFLYGAVTGADDGIEELIRSTEAKITEIGTLREACLDRYGEQLAACADAVADRAVAGGRVLSFGNGGSSTDAQAVATMFAQPPAGRRPIPAVSLAADTAVLTALANDVGFEVVYARQLATLARPQDIAVALSTSGNSANVMRALAEAADRAMLTVGFAGNDGGQMAAEGRLDFLFVVPSSSVHRIQEAQTSLYHVLWELTQQSLEGVSSRP